MYIEEVPIGFGCIGCTDEACPLHLLQFAHDGGARVDETPILLHFLMNEMD